MDDSLAEKFRERSKEMREAAAALLTSPSFTEDSKKLIAAIVGQIDADLYDALGDMLDYQVAKSSSDPKMAARKSLIAKNDAIRKAAAKGSATGDWNEFDRLAAANG